MSNGLDPDLGPNYLQRLNYQLTTKVAASKESFLGQFEIFSAIFRLFCCICVSLVKLYIQLAQGQNNASSQACTSDPCISSQALKP